MLTFALLLFAGPPCRAPAYINGYRAPVYQTYAPAAYSYTPTYYAPTYEYVDRTSFAVFQVGNGQQQQLLETLNQQARTLDATLRAEQARSARLEQLILTPQAAPHQLPSPPPPQGHVEAAAPAAANVAALRQAGATVLVARCTKCHAGAMGERNKWVLDPAQLASPSPRLRFKIQQAVFRKENPMPQNGSLTEQEGQAVLGWGQIAEGEFPDSPTVAQSPSK